MYRGGEKKLIDSRFKGFKIGNREKNMSRQWIAQSGNSRNKLTKKMGGSELLNFGEMPREKSLKKVHLSIGHESI